MKILDFWDDSVSMAEWLLTYQTNLAYISPQCNTFNITGGALELSRTKTILLHDNTKLNSFSIH
jgi:hypothetical protein